MIHMCARYECLYVPDLFPYIFFHMHATLKGHEVQYSEGTRVNYVDPTGPTEPDLGV